MPVRIFLYIPLLQLLLASCGDGGHTKQIGIGEYVLEVPADYELIRENGIDSYVGKITNGRTTLYFDYGYYSDKLERSLQEYVSQDVWKWNALAANKYLASGDDLSLLADSTRLIGQEPINDKMIRLSFVYRADTVHYQVEIPDEVRLSTIETDTIDQVFRKLVRRGDYAGLYVTNLRTFQKSINACPALSLTAEHISRSEKPAVVAIMRSCRMHRE